MSYSNHLMLELEVVLSKLSRQGDKIHKVKRDILITDRLNENLSLIKSHCRCHTPLQCNAIKSAKSIVERTFSFV